MHAIIILHAVSACDEWKKWLPNDGEMRYSTEKRRPIRSAADPARGFSANKTFELFLCDQTSPSTEGNTISVPKEVVCAFLHTFFTSSLSFCDSKDVSFTCVTQVIRIDTKLINVTHSDKTLFRNFLLATNKNFVTLLVK